MQAVDVELTGLSENRQDPSFDIVAVEPAVPGAHKATSRSDGLLKIRADLPIRHRDSGACSARAHKCCTRNDGFDQKSHRPVNSTSSTHKPGCIAARARLLIIPTGADMKNGLFAASEGRSQLSHAGGMPVSHASHHPSRLLDGAATSIEHTTARSHPAVSTVALGRPLAHLTQEIS